MASDEYPLPAFYFRVVFATTSGNSDTSFQEVSGISSEMDAEDYTEGGENRFVYKLPTTIKHGNLVLKRGIADKKSPLVKWCCEIFENGFTKPIKPMLVKVFLMNEKNNPVRGWSFANAYPVKWEVESFNSTKNDVAIESIELSYNYSNRVI